MVEIRQLFEIESCTYSYLVVDAKSRETILIDPVIETLSRDIEVIHHSGANLKYIAETHIHADHQTSAMKLKKEFNSTILASVDGGQKGVDEYIEHGQKLYIGETEILFLHTQGHTNSCMSIIIEDNIFSGDCLLIGKCGRTDFQQGDNEKLFHSVREILFRFDDQFKVYPGHDYSGRPFSTIGEEKKYNSRLGLDKSYEDFQKIMQSLNLDYPKKIDKVLPLNMDLTK